MNEVKGLRCTLYRPNDGGGDNRVVEIGFKNLVFRGLLRKLPTRVQKDKF